MDPNGSAVRMGPHLVRPAPKVGAVAKAIEVNFPRGRVVVDRGRSRFCHCPTRNPEIAKLEAAMVAVGESDPTFPSLFDALQKTRALAEVQPVPRPQCKHGIFHYTRQEARGDRGQRCGDAKTELAQGRIETKLAFEAKLSRTGSEDCAVNTNSQWIRFLQTWKPSSRRCIPPAGALSFEVGARCPSDRTRFE